MKKNPLIEVSIITVVLLILSSLANVIGYQTVQSSNQNIINNEVNQKELLFQTIVDIANNKEIQRIIFKSQINREDFFDPDARFLIFNSSVLTKNHLKQMYVIGLMLSKIISKSRIHSMVEQYQLNYHMTQKEISAVIEKNSTFKGKITQLSNSECDCENKNTTVWHFPILCLLLVPFLIIGILLAFKGIYFFGEIIVAIMSVLHCNMPP